MLVRPPRIAPQFDVPELSDARGVRLNGFLAAPVCNARPAFAAGEPLPPLVATAITGTGNNCDVSVSVVIQLMISITCLQVKYYKFSQHKDLCLNSRTLSNSGRSVGGALRAKSSASAKQQVFLAKVSSFARLSNLIRRIPNAYGRRRLCLTEALPTLSYRVPQTQRTGEFRLTIEHKIEQRMRSRAGTLGKTSGSAGRTVDNLTLGHTPRGESSVWRSICCQCLQACMER